MIDMLGYRAPSVSPEETLYKCWQNVENFVAIISHYDTVSIRKIYFITDPGRESFRTLFDIDECLEK